MWRTIPILFFVVAGCRSVEITPARIRAAAVEGSDHARVLETWSAAVSDANAFLDSPFRRTLPRGRLELDEERGMLFVTDERTWPVRVECTTWGDVCVEAGFAAQERSWGFVVGSRPPGEDGLVDNSLFRDGNGALEPPERAAELILHELTHTVHGTGTVGFWKGLAYYFEAIFLFRYAKHSAERYPRGTSQEFLYFDMWRDAPPDQAPTYLEVFEEHLAGPATKSCRHGLPEEGG